MSRIRFLALLTALCCLCGSASLISAAEVESGSVYCFSREDFSTEEGTLTGICITHLPQIAAMADTHFYIRKQDLKEHNFSKVWLVLQCG